jgi:hypothetical protein
MLLQQSLHCIKCTSIKAGVNECYAFMTMPHFFGFGSARSIGKKRRLVNATQLPEQLCSKKLMCPKITHIHKGRLLTPCIFHHLHVRSRRLCRLLPDRQGMLRWQQYQPLAPSVLTAHVQPVCHAVAVTMPRSYR